MRSQFDRSLRRGRDFYDGLPGLPTGLQPTRRGPEDADTPPGLEATLEAALISRRRNRGDEAYYCHGVCRALSLY